MRTRVLRLVFSLAMAAGLMIAPGATSSARTALPSIGLLSVIHNVEIFRFPGEPLFLPGGVFLASSNGAFELWATRLPDGGVDVRQMRRQGTQVTEIRHLPFDPTTSFDFGLAEFMQLTWLDGNGATIVEQAVPFCTASWDVSRTNDSGPTTPTYPQYCGSSLTQTNIWGIDAGWATGAFSSSFVEDPGLEDGTYTLNVEIADKYAQAFEIPSGQRSASVEVTLTTFDDPFPCPPRDPCPFRQNPANGQSQAEAMRAQPPGVAPNVDGLPDLRALPAFAMGIEHTEEGLDNLIFGANVWNAGPGPLVVEGFRTGDALVMPATQYFYTKGKVSGKAPVGSFEFHTAPDHFHWHFEDFAGYDILDANQTSVVKSGKQSFCLAPTDPIDLTLPGAQWQPDRIGFFTACGSLESIWIREVMPAGWGDTYFQFISGQSFDVTDLPNGDYFVRVSTNPNQILKETDYTNNVALQHIALGGRPGARTVQIL